MDEVEKIHQILIDVQALKDAVARLQSHAESERDVRKDTHIEINKRISELDKFIREVFYDAERGFLIKLDRLTQESLDRKKMKQNIAALWVSLIATAVSFGLSLFMR